MSAITGLYAFRDGSADPVVGRSMLNELRCCPADRVSDWHDGPVFLGCHAQWITPESKKERLPYYDPARRLAITADAILDNRAELFERLGIEPRRQSDMQDSELILLAYRRWGDEALHYLIGDFAFVIWDEARRRLFGARDFSGGRPLYYMCDADTFAFSTMMGPLLSLPSVKRELDEAWLAEFLAITAPADSADASLTPYRSIRQVPPAHCIAVEGGRIALRKYCALTPAKPLRLKTDGEYIEAFREVFQEAVKARLRTRRGIAAHLSGGLDSGSVVGFAAEALRAESRPLHTFSYIPPPDFEDYTPKHMLADETPFIESTVRHIGAIREHYLDFGNRDSFTDIDPFLDTLEMPYKFFENSFWLGGMFEKAREEDIGVLLSGARGNLTISWGPALDRYAALLKSMRWLRLLAELNAYSRRTGGPRLRMIPDIAGIAFPALDRLLRNSAPYVEPSVINRSFAERTRVYERLKAYGIGSSGWLASTDVYEQRLLHFRDVFHWNTTNTLTAKLSLRYGLWQRDPTNDLRVIRFCLSVPENQYVTNGLDRALIRRSTAGLLPDRVRLNQRVRGVQGADWVHRMLPRWGEFVEELRRMSRDERMLGYLDGNVIRTALQMAEGGGKPAQATDPHIRILMRSLIVYRYMNRAFA